MWPGMMLKIFLPRFSHSLPISLSSYKSERFLSMIWYSMIFSFFKLVTELHFSCLDKREKEIVTDRPDPLSVSWLEKDATTRTVTRYDMTTVWYSIPANDDKWTPNCSRYFVFEAPWITSGTRFPSSFLPPAFANFCSVLQLYDVALILRGKVGHHQEPPLPATLASRVALAKDTKVKSIYEPWSLRSVNVWKESVGFYRCLRLL